MNKRINISFLIIGILTLIIACQTDTQTIQETPKNISDSKTNFPLQYAKNFTIDYYKNCKIINIKQSSENATKIIQYVLHPKGEIPPKELQADAFIPTPISSFVCLSTTHVALLNSIGAIDNIKAVAGGNFMYNPTIQERLKTGEIREIGSDQSINYETLLDLQPELVLNYAITADNKGKKLKELGLKYIMVAEYLEETALARTEWMVFLAAFLDKEKEAAKQFLTIANAYEGLKKQIENQPQKPSVFTGIPFQGTWYVPGGKSFVAQYIHDAGGDYLWKNTKEKSSLTLDFEAVYEKAQSAEKWLDIGMVSSLKDMQVMDNRFTEFKAFKQGEIYNYNARISEGGGYDIYESGVVEPHLVLKDFINMIHPNFLKEKELYYYRKLK